MRCSQAELWISTAIDGEPLSAPVRAALATHLADCPACREFSIRERENSAFLAGILAPPEADRAAKAILLAAHSGRTAGDIFVRRSVHWRRFSVAAAAAVLAVAGLLGVRLREWTAPPGRTPVPLPPDPAPASLQSLPFHLIGDEREWAPVPGADGSPWGKETRRVRGVLFDPAVDGSVDGNRPQLPRLEFELNGTRYLRLVDFPQE